MHWTQADLSTGGVATCLYRCVDVQVFDVTTGGYYAWVKRVLSIRQREEERLELEIRATNKRTHQTYGPERLQRDIADNDVVVRVHRMKRIRRKLGLRCRQKRKFKITTDS